MGGPARDGMDLFFWLKKRGIKKTIENKIWNKNYFWQDTVITRWNRLIGCKFGHKNINYIEDDNGNLNGRKFCFACYRDIKE